MEARMGNPGWGDLQRPGHQLQADHGNDDAGGQVQRDTEDLPGPRHNLRQQPSEEAGHGGSQSQQHGGQPW